MPGVLAHSCYPSYGEARTVGWLEVLLPLPQWLLDFIFYVRTVAFLLWWATRGGKSSSMMKQGQRLHAAQSGESSSPDPVLNIVITINVWKSPIKIFLKKKIYILCFLFLNSANRNLKATVVIKKSNVSFLELFSY